MAKEFKYTIEKKYGVVSTAGPLPIELNLIAYGDSEARFDLRKWRDRNGVREMQKGITMTRAELLDLREFLNSLEVM